jgi:tetrahydromethanopterin S-methyltransferase subunit F
MMVIASAAMTNIRRIHGYVEKLREENRKARAVQK